MALKKNTSENWLEGANDLLAQIAFGKRFRANSRIMTNAILAQAIVTTSLHGLVSILNHPACPRDVVGYILDGLEPLQYAEYGNRHVFIYECLTFCLFLDDLYRAVDEKQLPRTTESLGFVKELFLQKNTTKNYFFDFYTKALEYDRQAPFLWTDNPRVGLKELIISKKGGGLGKLKNPVGKRLFSWFTANASMLIFKSQQLYARYQMTRILAELRFKYKPGSDLQEVLAGLASYKTLDPGSGKSFCLNIKRGVLYGIGVDKKDDGGEENNHDGYRGDVVIPLSFWHATAVAR